MRPPQGGLTLSLTTAPCLTPSVKRPTTTRSTSGSPTRRMRMTTATQKRYQLPRDSATQTPHTTERNWRTANENLILLTEVGSGLHGGTTGADDQDLQGVCIEPPNVMLGMSRFELYEYRTKGQGERSGA